MNVLLVAPKPPPYGGIGNWTAMVLDYVNETEDEMDVISITPKKRSTEGRTIFDRVIVSGFKMLAQNRMLRKKIRQNRPDVIHMTTSGQLAIFRDLMMLRTAKKHNVPTLYHIRFGRTADMAENNTKMWGAFRKAMKMASVVVAIDKKTYEAIKKHVPEANVRLLPNPVNTKTLPVPPEAPKKQVVFVGWVIPTKGTRELVEAWNTVGKNHPDYKLVIVGQSKPDYLEMLKGKVEVDNIVFTGEMQHDDAMKAMAESEIFILPSYTEGFPNAVVEAMALARPVVATSVGAIPEMLEGDCGIVIEPQSVQAVIDGLERALGDENYRKTISCNAYERATGSYALEAVYAQYQKLWAEIKEN